MKFTYGDKVLVKSDHLTGLNGSPSDFAGHVGIIVSLPDETGWPDNYGINFGCKIYKAINHKIATHNLHGTLRHNYGQYVHEADLELFAYGDGEDRACFSDEGVDDLI